MAVGNLNTVTRTPGLAPTDSYHEAATATQPRYVYWTGSNVRRWFPVIDETRGGSASSVIVNRLVSSGMHDTLAVLFNPHGLAAVCSPEDAPILLELRRRVVRPTSFLGETSIAVELASNATTQAVEDLVFTDTFLHRFGPTLCQIDRLSTLLPGWDSRGATKIEARPQMEAARLVRYLYGDAPELPPPFIAPTPDGGVELEWNLRDYEISIDIKPETCEYYVAQSGETGVLIEGSASIDRLPEVARELLPYFH